MNQQVVLAPASKPQEYLLNSTSTVTLYAGSAGSGKALRHGEKVHTPYGWVNIEDCYAGMTISSPDGTTQKVTAVYPQGEVDIYRVTFQDNSFVDTCGEHLWLYHEAQSNGKKKVNSTLHLKERIALGYRPIVPLTKPVAFSTGEELKIKPYTLGVLLGDGSITTNSISFTSNDPEIADYVKEDGYEISVRNTVEGRAGSYGVGGLTDKLREMNLMGCNSLTKFIPEEYKNASVQDKFSLVQGLMDTDGYIDCDGCTEYCTISNILALDLADILRSLGFTVTVSEKKTFFTYRGEKKAGALAYNLYIRGNNQRSLFKLKRKLERVVDKKVGNRIVSIEAVGKDYATCISVSGEDSLFITTNYIVTHNTFALLLTALKFMSYPRATGVIFRRTSTMIKAPGSIWHEAVAMYSSIFPNLKIRNRELEIVFPNDSVLRFSHMQYLSNVYDHKGAQYSFVAFDEATDFDDPLMVTFLLSRMRNANVPYEPQMFLCTNPRYESWIRTWIEDFYLDPDTGIPLESKTNVERFFFVEGNNIRWYNTKEEAEAVHGVGSESGVRTFRSIKATVWDNKPLLKNNPSYISNLMALSDLERRIMLDGSWTARLQATGHFKQEWVSMVDNPNYSAFKRVRAYDLAFTEHDENNPRSDPDYTASVLMSKDKGNMYTVEDAFRMRKRAYDVEKRIFETAIADGTGVAIILPKDPNAAAGQYARDLQRRLAEKGFTCHLVSPVKSKLVRFSAFASVANARCVSVVRADWNKDYFEELELFSGDGKRHDDWCDATSDAFLALNRTTALPDFTLPDMSSNNNLDFSYLRT